MKIVLVIVTNVSRYLLVEDGRIFPFSRPSYALPEDHEVEQAFIDEAADRLIEISKTSFMNMLNNEVLVDFYWPKVKD